MLSAAGLPVRFFSEHVPTPLVAYAARQLAASAAIVVTDTASGGQRLVKAKDLVYPAVNMEPVMPHDPQTQRAIDRLQSRGFCADQLAKYR